MSIAAVLLIVGAVFLLLAALEAPIAFALLGAGSVGIALVNDVQVAGSVLGASFFSTTAHYALLVIPMYLLLGALIANSGIGEQIYRSIHRLIGTVTGGLAASAVAATALFSGISGSSAADVAAFGRISVTEMARHGYDKAYSAAVVAAAGTFASLIPPSIALLIYAVLAGESVGEMLLAGVVPGIASAVILVVFVIGRAMTSKSGDFGGVSPTDSATPVRAKRGLRSDLSGVLYALVISFVVIGGLYGGFLTATEAGAFGAAIALLVALARTRTMRGRWDLLRLSVAESARGTGMIFMLLTAGSIITYFVASAGVARELTSFVLGLDVPPKVIAAIVLLCLLPLGMFLDGLSIMLITVPVIAPVIVDIGLDPVWFGILILKVVEVGLITPPVGINVFVISGITDVSSGAVFRRVFPFVVLDMVVTALFFAFPGVVLWLPHWAGY